MQRVDLYSYSFNNNDHIEFRLISNDDSIEELTQLLHRSYKILADMGLNYLATRQDNNITLQRTSQAYKCYVGIYKRKIAATICLYCPTSSDENSWYDKDYVAKIGQFAVEPELQKWGIGSKMMDIVEDEARKIENVRELALDTAETAYHLIDFYKTREYRYIETIQWEGMNYKSIVLSKSLNK